MWFQFITSVQRYTYVRFLMKNLIRSKEEQLRKQEAEIEKKTHENALLEHPSVTDLVELGCSPGF